MTGTCRAVLIHVAENLLQKPSDHPLHQCTIGSGFDSVSDLFSLSEMDIASLIYRDVATGSEKQLKVFKKKLDQNSQSLEPIPAFPSYN